MRKMTTRQIKMFFASSKKGNPVLLVRFHFEKYALSLQQTYLVYEICLILSHESNLRLRIGPLQSDHTFLVYENFMPQSSEFILRLRIGLAPIVPYISGLQKQYAAFGRVQFSIQNWTYPNWSIHICFTESLCCICRSPIFDSELDP